VFLTCFSTFPQHTTKAGARSPPEIYSPVDGINSEDSYSVKIRGKQSTFEMDCKSITSIRRKYLLQLSFLFSKFTKVIRASLALIAAIGRLSFGDVP
jgi:hypothetical protein